MLFLSIPLTCLTLGLFVLVINTAMFALAAWLVPSFQVSGLLGAFIGALAVSSTQSSPTKIIKRITAAPTASQVSFEKVPVSNFVNVVKAVGPAGPEKK